MSIDMFPRFAIHDEADIARRNAKVACDGCLTFTRGHTPAYLAHHLIALFRIPMIIASIWLKTQNAKSVLVVLGFCSPLKIAFAIIGFVAVLPLVVNCMFWRWWFAMKGETNEAVNVETALSIANPEIASLVSLFCRGLTYSVARPPSPITSSTSTAWSRPSNLSFGRGLVGIVKSRYRSPLDVLHKVSIPVVTDYQFVDRVTS